MAKKNVLKEWSNEELIVEYALRFNEETKKARKREESIFKELASRGVIDLEKMEALYKRRAL